MVDTVENMANNLLKNSETILNRALDNNYLKMWRYLYIIRV